MKVSEILKVKGNILFTVTPDSPMIDAVNAMADKDIGSLVVIENGNLIGMLTFREVMATIRANGGSVGSDSVRKHMDTSPTTITSNIDVNDVRRLMLDSHVRYMPVLEGKNLVGVMSFYDVAKAVLEEQSFENKMLKSYIQDTPVEVDS